MTAPRIVVGIPTYNNARHAPRALESLLVQTHPEIAFIGCDDGSTDGTAEIAAEYAARDPRFTFERNSERLGMVRNWRRVFERARELHPSMEYFAWGSDHDVWHPSWARKLAAELDGHPEAVLAYPLGLGIWEDGSPQRVTRPFDTAGERSVDRRLKLGWRGMAAGTMVYGLYRADALEACGVYRMVLLPDRLLMTELALHGEFRQVPTVLWQRRLREGVVKLNARQRAAFFPGRRAPLYMHLPWSVQHTGVLASQLAVHGRGPNQLGRLHGLRVALAYFFTGIAIEIPRTFARNKTRVRRWIVPRVRALRKRMRTRLRTAGIGASASASPTEAKQAKPAKPAKAPTAAKPPKPAKPQKPKKAKKAKAKKPATQVKTGRI